MNPSFHSLKLILFSSLAAILVSCQKDENSPTNPDNASWGSSISLTITGKVLDDASGNPLSGAIVKAGAASDTTDNNGIFVLKNAPALAVWAMYR